MMAFITSFSQTHAQHIVLISSRILAAGCEYLVDQTIFCNVTPDGVVVTIYPSSRGAL